MESKLPDIFNDIFALSLDFAHGNVDYSFNKLHSAMKTNVYGLFCEITEDFIDSMICGRKVSKEQLQTLYDNLISFGEEFKVERSKAIAAMVKEEIDKMAAEEK